MGETRNGLLALASCLEEGYDDFAQIRSDPDLSPLREDERFENVMRRFEPDRSTFWGRAQYELDPRNSVLGRFLNQQQQKK